MHWASCRNPRPRSGLSLACQRKRKVPEQGCGTPALTISWQPLASAARPSQRRPPPNRARDGDTRTQTHTLTPPLSHPQLGTQVTHPRSQGDPLRPLPTCTSTGRAPRHEATSRQLRPPPREGSLASFRMCQVPKSSQRGHSSPTRSWGPP